MPNRFRQESRGHITGRKTNGQGTFVASNSSPSSTIRCNDVTAGGDDGLDFDAYAYYQTGGIIDRIDPGTWTFVRNFYNWRADRITNLPSDLHKINDVPGSPTNSSLATKLVAMTNPSRPIVDAPVALAELREIPSLLKNEGGDLIRRLGSTNLKYQFGVKPLVNDIIKSVLFQRSVNDRVKELTALNRSGLKRKRTLWSGSNTSTLSGQFFNSNNYSVVGDVRYSDYNRKWGFVEWFPDSPSFKTDESILNDAYKAVFGLTVDFSTAWNLIPWSWLVDWFTDIGDYLEGTRNIVGASHGPIQIMTFRRTVGMCPQTGSMSRWDYTATHKSRRLVAPSVVSATLPFLDGRQFSILASIGVTRRKPGYLSSL